MLLFTMPIDHAYSNGHVLSAHVPPDIFAATLAFRLIDMQAMQMQLSAQGMCSSAWSSASQF